MVPDYRVVWEIDIEADTPEKAALEALEIQRDRESLATFFAVVDPKTRMTTLVDTAREARQRLRAGRTFKKTVLRVEVLSEQEWTWHTLEQVAYSITEGGCSGTVEEESVKLLSEEDTARALVAQGSDPSFLLGPDWEGPDEA